MWWLAAGFFLVTEPARIILISPRDKSRAEYLQVVNAAIIDDLHRQLSRSSQKITDLRESLDTDHQAALMKKIGEISSIKSELGAEKRDHAALKTITEAQDKEIEGLKVSQEKLIADHKVELDKQEIAHRPVQIELVAQKRVTAKFRRIATIQRVKIKQLSEDNELLTAEHQNDGGVIALMLEDISVANRAKETELAEKDVQIELLGQKLDNESREIERLEGCLRSMGDDIIIQKTATHKSNKELNQKLDEKCVEFDKLSDKVKLVEAHKSAVDRRNKSLSQEANARNVELDRLSAEVKVIGTHKPALEKRNEQLGQKLDAKNIELDRLSAEVKLLTEAAVNEKKATEKKSAEKKPAKKKTIVREISEENTASKMVARTRTTDASKTVSDSRWA